MKLYSLRDVKAGTYGPVMMAQNDGHMGRTLVESFRGSGHTVEKYPGDFELFQIAEFDASAGTTDRELRFVCNVSVLFDGGKVNA